MSQKTVRCRLISTEENRKALWLLMAERNTPLINEALRQLPSHSDFPKWRQKGKLPDIAAKCLIDRLKTDARFANQPVWYCISAQKHVTYIFRSWLAIQRRKQWKLEGKRRWLEILQPDTALAEKAGCSIEALREEAGEIIAEAEIVDPFRHLLAKYRETEDVREQCAIAYLLKRKAELEPEEENLAKLVERHRKTEIFIQRLEAQLDASLPKGRDLTGHLQAEALIQSIHSPLLDDSNYNTWKDALTTEPAKFPFPIMYETTESLVLSRDDRGRILLRFSGLSQQTYKIYCDKPHQHWFERFFEDQETKRVGGDQHSAAAFTLRSAQLMWVPSEKHRDEPDPWNRYYLNLSCTVDTRLWTQEGTKVVVQEKAVKTAQKLTSMQEKKSLTQTQRGYIRRLESTLQRLQNPYPRPSRTVYWGQPEILVGVSMSLDKTVTIAVVNALTEQVLTYRSAKQLLGERYRLLQRARKEIVKISHQGHRQRRKGGRRISQESDVGKYVDRLIAKAIDTLALKYRAGSIVLPNLAYIRESIEAEVQQRAIEKVPDFKDGQKQYAKAYRTQIHRWPFSRLQSAIISKAEQSGITIEIATQQISGSFQDKARELGLQAYAHRSAS